MTHTIPISNDVADADILRAIGAALADQPGRGSIATMQRTPWDYATSAALELVTVRTDDNVERHFVLKHLGPRSMSESARRAKPSFVVDPRREIEVYRRLLAPLHVGPSLIGFQIAPHTGVYWLLLEQVRGCRLFEAGELERWVAVARWLGALHGRLATLDCDALRREARLVEYDREWYTVWLNRGLRFFASDDPPHSRCGRAALRWLAARYDKVVERLMSLTPTIIHGEFYASNVLIAGDAGDPRICPVDWEMTSIGPGIMDLAALTSGTWSELDRRAMIAGYVTGSGAGAATIPEDVSECVEYAQIHLAVQWLGWFGRRQAPVEHAHDWLADATERAEALKL